MSLSLYTKFITSLFHYLSIKHKRGKLRFFFYPPTFLSSLFIFYHSIFLSINSLSSINQNSKLLVWKKCPIRVSQSITQLYHILVEPTTCTDRAPHIEEKNFHTIVKLKVNSKKIKNASNIPSKDLARA